MGEGIEEAHYGCPRVAHGMLTFTGEEGRGAGVDVVLYAVQQ